MGSPGRARPADIVEGVDAPVRHWEGYPCIQSACIQSCPEAGLLNEANPACQQPLLPKQALLLHGDVRNSAIHMVHWCPLSGALDADPEKISMVNACIVAVAGEICVISVNYLNDGGDQYMSYCF